MKKSIKKINYKQIKIFLSFKIQIYNINFKILIIYIFLVKK
jgi:hypothetical protein